MSELPSFEICGLGAWSPGFAGPPEFDTRAHDPEVKKPPAKLLAARLRRRTSLLTRMVLEVAEQASRSARRDVSDARLVVASAWGEITTTVDLLEQLQDDAPELSPTKFHNSVHNTATGYTSIATKNRRGATAIAAGDRTVEMGFVEAVTALHTTGEDVLLVLADEPVPEAFGRSEYSSSAPLAIGVYMRPIGATDHAGRHTTLARKGTGDASVYAPFAALPADIEKNPCASAAHLVACQAGRGAVIALSSRPDGLELLLPPGLPLWFGIPHPRRVVPHAAPMVLLDRIIALQARDASLQDAHIECEAVVRRRQPLLQDGALPATACLEYMAQAIACMGGVHGVHRGEGVGMGFLLGSRELKLHKERVPVGSTLRVRAKHVFGQDKLGSFECAVDVAQEGGEPFEPLASATINVYRGDLSEVLD